MRVAVCDPTPRKKHKIKNKQIKNTPQKQFNKTKNLQTKCEGYRT